MYSALLAACVQMEEPIGHTDNFGIACWAGLILDLG